MQVGNTQMGEVGRKAVEPVTEPAPVEPPAPPVIKPPRRIKEIKPRYTAAAERDQIEGTIVLRVTIDKKGRVVKVQLIRGLGYGLDEVTIEAVKLWRYSPKTVDGEPVRSTKTENVEFILEDY